MTSFALKRHLEVHYLWQLLQSSLQPIFIMASDQYIDYWNRLAHQEDGTFSKLGKGCIPNEII